MSGATARALDQYPTKVYIDNGFSKAMDRHYERPLKDRREGEAALNKHLDECCKLQCTPNQKVSVCALFSFSLISLFIGATSINAEDSTNRTIGVVSFAGFGVLTLAAILGILKNRICPPSQADEERPLTPPKITSRACCKGENSCSCKKVVLMGLLIIGSAVAFSWGTSGKLDAGVNILLDGVGSLAALGAAAVIFEACISNRH